MKVTPLDIRRKEFKRSVRGYADEEVDLFLDEVADEIERLVAENADLLERLRRQEGELAGNLQMRDALQKTLVSAQIQADDTKAKARAEAEQMLRDADAKAQGIVNESYVEVQRVQQALVQLKHLEEDFRSKFQTLLQGHLKMLSEPGIAIPATEPMIVQPAPMPVAFAPAAAAAAVPTPAPVVAPAPAPVVETPFVVPSAFEEVPEYQQLGVVTQAVTPAYAEPAAVASAVPAALTVPAVLQPPEPLLWRDETADLGKEDTATVDSSAVFPTIAEDPTGTMSDSSTFVNDDSVTLVGEDPLQGFFFSGRDEAAADVQPGDGRGGKNKPRDFEW